MADNVDFQTAALATPANATRVATDQLAGGEHVQYFKLMDGTPDSSTKGIIDANGLLVNVGDRPARQLGIVASIAAAVALAAGSALIGSVKLSDGVDTALVSAAGELSTDLSDRAGRALGIVASITNPVAVTGTFWQATQPVSLAAAVDVSDRAGRALGVVASITAAVDVSDRAARALGVVASITAPVKIFDGVDTALVTTSGMLQVMQARDIARVNKSIKFNSAAAPAADTLCSCVLNTDGVDAAGATTFAVTAGKRFRIQGIKLSVRTTTAATPWGEATVRMNPSGAAVIGSPYVHRITVGGTAAVIGNVAADYYFFIEGWEISGTQQIGISFANNVATNVTDIVLFGYEYTP